MRVLGWVLLVLWLPGRVLAAPEPPPPGDYPGAQYIDRTGCVFLREGSEWLPRLDKQGRPVCGFPPSKPAEQAESSVPPPSPEEVLTATLAEGLKPGDLTTDRPAQPLRNVPPDPEQAALTETLAREAAVDRRLRDITTPAAPAGLCAKLGYRPATEADILSGGDVTQGLCPGMVADPGPALSIAADRSRPDKAAAPAEGIASNQEKAAPAPGPAKPGSTGSAGQQTRAPSTPPSAVIARRPSPAEPASQLAVEMIPAHARYVQIGVYADEGNALAALRNLSAMGYRTAQKSERVDDKAAKAVLAGPFADRQALVRALIRLRANGYPRAVAR